MITDRFEASEAEAATAMDENTRFRSAYAAYKSVAPTLLMAIEQVTDILDKVLEANRSHPNKAEIDQIMALLVSRYGDGR